MNKTLKWHQLIFFYILFLHNNWDRIACRLYSRPWCLIWRSPGQLQGAHWSANYTPHTEVPPCSRILLPPRAHNLLVSRCTHCNVDVVNPTLQIRRIGNLSAVALWSPMCEITADAPVFDVRHQHRSDTTCYWNFIVQSNPFNITLEGLFLLCGIKRSSY